MSGWRATIPTERLFGDPRFLMLDESDQSLLLRLYARCDKWGRGPAHRNVLAVHLCLMRADVREQLGRLGAFVLVYPVDGHEYYQVLDYDADAMRETLRKRGTSNYPAPPQAGATVVVNDTQAGPTPAKVDIKAGLEVAKPEPNAGPTPAQRRPNAGLTHPETHHEAGLTPQKTGGDSALVRARQRSERGEERERESGKAGPTPAWTPPPWPTPDHERAAERFLAGLEEHTQQPAMYKPSALAELAVSYRDVFVGAVDEAGKLGVGWKGWHVKQPRNWLETLCKQAAEERGRSKPPAARTVPKSEFPTDGPRVIGKLR